MTGAKGNLVAFVHDYTNLRPAPVVDCSAAVTAERERVIRTAIAAVSAVK